MVINHGISQDIDVFVADLDFFTGFVNRRFYRAKLKRPQCGLKKIDENN